MVSLTISVTNSVGLRLSKLNVLGRFIWGKGLRVGRISVFTNDPLCMQFFQGGMWRWECSRPDPEESPGLPHSRQQVQTWSCPELTVQHRRQIPIKESKMAEVDCKYGPGKGCFCKLSAPMLMYLQDGSQVVDCSENKIKVVYALCLVGGIQGLNMYYQFSFPYSFRELLFMGIILNQNCFCKYFQTAKTILKFFKRVESHVQPYGALSIKTKLLSENIQQPFTRVLPFTTVLSSAQCSRYYNASISHTVCHCHLPVSTHQHIPLSVSSLCVSKYSFSFHHIYISSTNGEFLGLILNPQDYSSFMESQHQTLFSPNLQ